MKKYVDENILQESLENKADTTTVESLQTILDNYIVETWTFTLEDGTTVTKQVVTSK